LVTATGNRHAALTAENVTVICLNRNLQDLGIDAAEKLLAPEQPVSTPSMFASTTDSAVKVECMSAMIKLHRDTEGHGYVVGMEAGYKADSLR